MVHRYLFHNDPLLYSIHKEKKCKSSSWMLQTCASPNSRSPRLLRIQGRIAPDDYTLPKVVNKVLYYKSAHRGRSPRQFERVIYLPDQWRGDNIPDCEIQNTVVVISCPLQVVMDEDTAGNMIFCSRTSDPDPASDEGIPATWHTTEVLTKGLQCHWIWSRGKRRVWIEDNYKSSNRSWRPCRNPWWCSEWLHVRRGSTVSLKSWFQQSFATDRRLLVNHLGTEAAGIQSTSNLNKILINPSILSVNLFAFLVSETFFLVSYGEGMAVL